MPLEFRARIRTLLPYVAPNHTIADLVYAHRDTNGSTSEASVVPVQNKPWEWTEYLGEASGTDAAKENLDTRSHAGGQYSAEQQLLIRNSGSLPLELFNASVIGKLVQVGEDGVPEDFRVEGNLRMLQDGFFTESVFQRDFRETRIDPAVLDAKLAVAKSTDQDGDGATNTAAASGSERRSSSRIASPVGSVRSRGSMQPPSAPSGSRRTSPATTAHHAHSSLSKVSGSSAGEPIDVDSLDISTSTTTTAGTKRKVPHTDDDEIQVIEGPAASAQTKKAKGKAKVKNR